MKKIFLFIVIILCNYVSAQFSYQTVIRDANGELLANKAVGFKFSILDGDTTSNAVLFSESHTVNTNVNGLATLEIGKGIKISGDLFAINFGDLYQFDNGSTLKVEIDPLGGSNYTISSKSTINLVPLATSALNSQSSFSSQNSKFSDSSRKSNLADSAKNFNGWTLNGNKIRSNEFIGTTNSESLRFKVNSIHAGEINIRTSSVSYGENALVTSSGINNVAIGNRSLEMNSTGGNNIAIGHMASFQNIEGNSNIAIGSSALSGSRGNNNIAIGEWALVTNVSSDNIGIGDSAMGGNLVQNSGNIGIGSRALLSLSTGNSNVAIGEKSMQSLESGSRNTAVGDSAFLAGTSTTNSIAIGYKSQPTASNQARIGNSSTSSIGGFVDWTNISDGRFKTNISENVPGLDFILKLRPLSYQLDINAIDQKLFALNSPNEEINLSGIQTGFIAQEVDRAATDLNFKFSGIDIPKNESDYYGLRYATFVVPIVKAMQEQQKTIEELKAELKSLKQLIEESSNK